MLLHSTLSKKKVFLFALCSLLISATLVSEPSLAKDECKEIDDANRLRERDRAIEQEGKNQ